MKKLFSLILTIIFASQAFATEFIIGNLKYIVTDAQNHIVSVEKATDDIQGIIVLTEHITNNGISYTLTSIGDCAFGGCINLREIIIPNSVTKIGEAAFSHCESLKEVILPNSIIYISDEAFQYCGLTNISIPNSTITIGKSAFYGCINLSSVNIGNSVTNIGDWAFYECLNLSTINIPGSVNSIGEYAFGACVELSTIRIPNSVKSIGREAFSICNATIYCNFQSEPLTWDSDWNKEHRGMIIWNSAPVFSSFAKDFVEPQLNKWQEKGEFEKISDWKNRVTIDARNAKIKELTQKAEKIYIEKYADKTLNLSLRTYDAENEVFLVKNTKYGDMLVPVPIEKAPEFKQQWNDINKKPQYFIENDNLSIAKFEFTMSDGSQYLYSNQASLNYEVAQVNYDFEPIDFTPSNSATSNGKQTITTTQRTNGKSDIDVNIPVSNTQQNNTFAVIIANENYQKEAQVPFAVNDGRTFAEYCKKTLGIPNNNVHIVTDATLNNMKYEVRWLKQVIDAYGGEARVIFYYAGHGIPDEAQKTAYLLPIDGFGNDVSTGYKLDDLYSTLGNLPSKSVTVFLDACFSGANRDGQMLASARGVAIKAKSSAPVGNMVVFSAAQGDETAYPNNEQQHGMFTYYLLKKIKETSGNVTYKDLGDYVTDNVRKQSIVVNGKSQTPVVVPSATVGGNWESWKLK